MSKTAAKSTKRFPVRKVTVAKGLPEAEGRQAVLRRARAEFGDGYQAATYNTKTGKGTAV
jgi:hypothetical protein